MGTYSNLSEKNNTLSVANTTPQQQSDGITTYQFVDNRPETVAQRKLQEMGDNRPETKQAAQLLAMTDSYTSRQNTIIQRQENNTTGLPDNLKSGIENLSGHSMDDVKVHYNSDKPKQLQAHAYAQGTDIHLGTGQEKHLPHEAWHVVQQKQGRVQPTMQMKGKVQINDDTSLEKEADIMGAKANTTPIQPVAISQEQSNALGSSTPTINQNTQKHTSINSKQLVQRKIGFEFQTSGTNTIFKNIKTDKKVNDGKKEYYEGPGFTIEGDEGDLELVTVPFDETESGFQEMAMVFSYMEVFANSIEGKNIPLTHLSNYFASITPIEGNLEGKEDVILSVQEKILTDPQTTVGIELSKLIDLAELLSNAKTRGSAYLSDKEDESGKKVKKLKTDETTSPMLGQEATKENLANNIGWKAFEHKLFQDLVKKAKEDVDSKFPKSSESLKGFLFLISMYSKAGADYEAFNKEKKYSTPANAKFAIPMMSRTNLADIFLKLPLEDKKFFMEHWQKIAGEFGGDQSLFSSGLGWEHYNSKFSINDWLDNIRPDTPESEEPGLDFAAAYEGLGDISNRPFSPKEGSLPAHEVNRPAYKATDEFSADLFIQNKTNARARYGLGTEKMLESTDIGKATDGGKNRTEGLIIELRKLGAKLTANEWWPFASDVFKLTVMVNQGKERRDEIVNNFIDS